MAEVKVRRKGNKHFRAACRDRSKMTRDERILSRIVAPIKTKGGLWAGRFSVIRSAEAKKPYLATGKKGKRRGKGSTMSVYKTWERK
jgi:hypothetical protein